MLGTDAINAAQIFVVFIHSLGTPFSSPPLDARIFAILQRIPVSAAIVSRLPPHLIAKCSQIGLSLPATGAVVD